MIRVKRIDQIRRYIVVKPYGRDDYEVVEFYQTKRDIVTEYLDRLPIVLRGYAGQFKIGQILNKEYVKNLIVKL